MKKYSGLVKIFSLLFILSILLVPLTSASAALRICRTDPFVYFTDGHKLSITASVSADAPEVTKIVYTVYAPSGSEVSKIVHTAGGLGLVEDVVVIANQPAGVYKTDTIVYTRTRGIAVKATMMFMVGISNAVSGQSFEHLLIIIKEPVSPDAYDRTLNTK